MANEGLARTPRFTLNLYAKISLLLLSVVIIPTALIGYLSFDKSSDQLQTVTSAFLLDNLQHNTQRVDELMQKMVKQSEKVIQSDELKALLRLPAPEDQLEEFDFIRQLNPVVDQLKGEYELALYPRRPELYPNYTSGTSGGEDWFLKALSLEGRGYWQLRSSLDGEPKEIVYTRTIRDFPHLHPLGVVTLKVPSFLVANQLVMPERVERLRFYIVNEQNLVVATKSIGNAVPVTAVDGAESPDNEMMPVRQRTIDGVSYYEAAKPLAMDGWRLVATIPVSDMMGPVETIKQFTWILVVSSVSVMSILLLVIVRTITVPIHSLVKHMRRMMLGELVYFREYGDRRDEIGQLIRGYNGMVTGMLDLIDKTKQFEEEKRRLEIRSLIHQMNPHFLYNTMDTIRWKAEKAGEPDIVRMVTALSNLLRFSINNGEELTTLERELEHVKSYLSIELQRNHDAFGVYIQVQPDILHYPFMKLTLQPLVENAVKHAVKRMKEGTGKILVSASLTEEGLLCRVEDNGSGSDIDLRLHFAEVERLGGSRESGVGLYNADRRLKLGFGATYGITMENRPEGGCKVALLHPVIETPQNIK